MQKVKAERNGNFTVINNYHLHDKNISTCAKTLMTLLLSLPEDWVLSVKGVSNILNESEYAVRKMMRELESCGYLKKEQHKGVDGKYTKMEYTVYELPYQGITEPEKQCVPDGEPSGETDIHTVPDMMGPASAGDGPEKPFEGHERAQLAEIPGCGPLVEIPQADNPHMGEPLVEMPRAAVLTLQNTDNNKINNNNPINPDPVCPDGSTGKELTDRLHALSQCKPDKYSFRQVPPPGSDRQRSNKPPAMMQREAYRRYRELLLGNIGYDSLRISAPHDIDTVDGLVDIMLEILCGTKPYIRISGTDYPQEFVKARFLKLRCGHMLYILDCLRENTSDVRNVKQYLLAVLFNAPATMDSFYALKVGHDLAAGLEEKSS